MSDCRFGVSPVNYPDPDPDPDPSGSLGLGENKVVETKENSNRVVV